MKKNEESEEVEKAGCMGERKSRRGNDLAA